MPPRSAFIGTRDIDSTPPAITNSCSPDLMPIAAKFTACWPDPQNRLIVTPVESLGHSAASTDIRAIHMAGLFPIRGDTTDNDVFDIERVEMSAVLQRIEGLRHEFLRVNLRQCPVFLASTSWGPDCINNPRFSHCCLLMKIVQPVILLLATTRAMS
jgi:hypothetical protein